MIFLDRRRRDISDADARKQRLGFARSVRGDGGALDCQRRYEEARQLDASARCAGIIMIFLTPTPPAGERSAARTRAVPMPAASI